MKTTLPIFIALLAVLTPALTRSAQAEVITPVIIDNGGSGYTTSLWSEQSGVADTFNSNQGFDTAGNNASAFARYTFSSLTATQQYRLFATWRQAGQVNASTVAPYTISDAGGTVTVNQTLVAGPARNLVLADTNGSGTLDFEFQYLNTVTAGGDSTITVTLNGTAPINTFSLSDAVVLAPVVSNLTIIDNGDAGYAQTGFTNETGAGAPPASFNSDRAYNSVANNGGFATWTFNGLAIGTYEVYATWDNDGQASLSTAAPYTISDGGGLVTVNQELGMFPNLIAADTDALNVGYFAFRKLGGIVTVLDGALQVRLDAVAGGGASDFVFADAIAIRLVEIIPTPAALPLGLATLGVMGLRRRRNA